MLEVDAGAVITLFLVAILVVVSLRLTKRTELNRKVVELLRYKLMSQILIADLYHRAVQAKEVDAESAVTVDMIDQFYALQEQGRIQ